MLKDPKPEIRKEMASIVFKIFTDLLKSRDPAPSEEYQRDLIHLLQIAMTDNDKENRKS